LHSIQTILVPLDGSDNSFRALNLAISLAKKLEAKLTLMYCVSIFPSIEVQIVDPIKCQIEERKYAESILDKAEKICKQYDIFLKRIIDYGTPGYTIIRFIKTKSNKIDLVIIGSRGRSTAKEIFLGSVSNYVLHKSPVPVMVVK
jgi:nucleotide-binding universal stress UspA family protein